MIFLWFGSWKNGISSFVPSWVKSDQKRFPRAMVRGGRSIEVLSPFSAEALQSDRRAYVRLLEHLKSVDARHTVLMMQLENEVGILGDSRDRSPAAEAAFTAPVPQALVRYLLTHKSTLNPWLLARWQQAGAHTGGSWSSMFGDGPATDELFMAWNYARYMDSISAAGKAVYPLPVFNNTWLSQPRTKEPGEFPSGGSQSYLLDIWKAGAPSIDMSCPDAYGVNFDEVATAYHRSDNPLFVPESQGEARGVANAFYAIGAQSAIGFSPFGLDNTAWLLTPSPAVGTPGTEDLENVPLAKAYAVLRNLAPLILEHQASGTIAAAWLNKDKPSQEIVLGNYRLRFSLRRFTRDQALSTDLGYAMAMMLGPDEYLVAGSDAQLTFVPLAPAHSTASIEDAEIGRFQGTQWIPARKLNGDDILLNYRLGELTDIDESGSGLRFLPGAPSIERVLLYRYR